LRNADLKRLKTGDAFIKRELMKASPFLIRNPKSAIERCIFFHPPRTVSPLATSDGALPSRGERAPRQSSGAVCEGRAALFLCPAFFIPASKKNLIPSRRAPRVSVRIGQARRHLALHATTRETARALILPTPFGRRASF
jgi:hypothetical protein